nr:cytochrome-c peroxidase [Chitinophagaceae bacterium]
MKKIKGVAGLLGIIFLLNFLLAFEGKAPKGWPSMRYPLPDSAKIRLGRFLFYDPILSRDNSISCASCHSQYTAFTHVDHSVSHGIQDRIGTRNAPALINLAWKKHFMWDGAIHHLDAQSLAPITNPLEMDETLAHVAAKLQHQQKYPSLFYTAFRDSVITGEHVLKSLSAFMLTMVSTNSRYDSMQRAEIQFTSQETRGYNLFKRHCASCHQEPLFTNDEFMNNGLLPDSNYNDIGRVKISLNVKDSFCFMVPTLRNIEFSYPYMHDGRFQT